MRKAFRILYTILMPILFVALLATCLSFEGELSLATSVSNSSSGATGEVNVSASTVINIKGTIFNLENWVAGLDKVFDYRFDLSSFSFQLVEDASQSSLSTGGEYVLTLHLLSIIGILIFGIGVFLSEVGYGSKVATLIGAIALIGGSVCIFADVNLNQGLRYIFTVDSGNGPETVFHLSWDWLTLKLVAGIADGLTLLNVLFVLLKFKKPAKD